MKPIKYNKLFAVLGVLLIVAFFIFNGLDISTIVEVISILIGIIFIAISQLRYYIYATINTHQKQKIISTYLHYILFIIVGGLVDILFTKNINYFGEIILLIYAAYSIFFIGKKIYNNEKFIWY